jgi:TonB family protein
MKHILLITVLVLTVSTFARGQSEGQAATVTGSGTASETPAAREELVAAALAYRKGDFVEAQQHAEKALELDPSSKTAPLFIARSIHARYRPGVESVENNLKAREAINAYQRILNSDPENDEAFKAIAALYGAIKEDELQYSWILQRASNVSVADRKRAEAYVILASKDWNCSYEITEQPKNKRLARKDRSDSKYPIVYRKPKEPKDFERAEQCVTRGMEMIETAIRLDPENESAWSFKTNLLLEMAKLAEMESNQPRRDEYRRLAEEAQQRTTEAFAKKQKEAGEAEQQERGIIINGGMLDGKAVSKPQPPYPPVAKQVRAQGIVVVKIVIDEEGKVISAKAVNGHPMLRAAAVQAATRARFPPTMLSGEPVKVSGTLSYTFTLE